MIEGKGILHQPALFMHVQKTAGTTMVVLAQRHYGRDNVASHADFIVRHGVLRSDGSGGTELDVTVRDTHEYSGIPFVSGHFGFDYARPLFDGRFSFTFLRDPIERILSFYHSCRARDSREYGIYGLARRLSLDDFLKRGLVDPEVRAFLWNHQTWQLASGLGNSRWRETLSASPGEMLSLAIAHLEAFSQVGFAETFEKDRDCVLQALGMPIPDQRVVENAHPLRPVFKELPGSSRALLYELTELDRQLYEAAWFRGNVAARRYLALSPASVPVESSAAIIDRTRDYYLGLLQQCLTGALYGDASFAPFGTREFDPGVRERGLDWPERAQTMVGDKRLANLRELVVSVLEEGIPGDLIETGVWRGGACILMRAILMAHGELGRKVWVADSFAGLPPGNDQRYPADAGSDFHRYAQLSVSLEEVQRNFRDYGLLDEQLVFLKGWFKDTLPAAPITRLALIRLDGDMYESTMDALQALYPKLSPGGYVIVDDYHVVPACRQAVHDYCRAIGMAPTLREIDGVGVYWQKSASGAQPSVSAAERGDVKGADPFGDLNQALACLHRVAIGQLLFSVAKKEADLARQRLRISRLEQHVAAQDGAVTALTRQIAAQDAAALDLSRALETSLGTIAGLQASTSWKLTAPLRALGTLLRKTGGRP